MRAGSIASGWRTCWCAQGGGPDLDWSWQGQECP
nr:MAG TPA: hypothetical protein [Caudoviricetes sp.]